MKSTAKALSDDIESLLELKNQFARVEVL